MHGPFPLLRFALSLLLLSLTGCGGSESNPAAMIQTNQPPDAVINAAGPFYSTEVAVIDGSSSHDGNGDELTYHWQVGECPVGDAVLDTPVLQFLVPPLLEPVSCKVSLDVSDGHGAFDRAVAQLHLLPFEPTGVVELSFRFSRNNVALGEDEAWVRLEVLDAADAVVFTDTWTEAQHLLTLPENAVNYRYRFTLDVSDKYYFLPDSAAWFYGQEFDLYQLLELMEEPRNIKVEDHDSTAYLRLIHIVGEDDEAYPDEVAGAHVFNVQMRIKGRAKRLAGKQCLYLYLDFGFWDSDGVPITDVVSKEVGGDGYSSCEDPSLDGSYTVIVDPVFLSMLDSATESFWDSYLVMDNDVDGFFTHYSWLGQNLYIDGELKYQRW